MTAARQPAGAAAAPPRRRPEAVAAIAAGRHGRIGPNAITRMAEALTGRHGATVCRAVFADAGLLAHFENPPTRMVDETEVTRLHAAAFARLGPRDAAAVSREAGRLTGDYLLAHRIPKPFQAVLKRLPRRLAAHILVRAIARHSWTFVGSGAFAFRFGAGLRLTIRGSAACRELRAAEPACHYYAATFERLFGEMLGQARCIETACEASGGDACVFDLTW